MTGDPQPYHWYYNGNYPWGSFQFQQYPQYIVSQEKHAINQEKRIIKANNGYIVAWEYDTFGTINTVYRIFPTFEEMQAWLKENV